MTGRKSKAHENDEEFHRRFADQIIEQIKQSTAPWQKPWKSGERVLPSPRAGPTRAAADAQKISDFSWFGAGSGRAEQELTPANSAGVALHATGKAKTGVLQALTGGGIGWRWSLLGI